MERFSTKTLPSEPVLHVLALPRDGWMKIGHLNVHSYLAKQEDIMKNQTMSCVNIMCFSETFLKPDQQIAGDFLPIREDGVAFRLDLCRQ